MSKQMVLKAAAEFLIEEEQCPTHPYWPGGKSGITWGVGWDASQQTEVSLIRDWGVIPAADLVKLKSVIGPANNGETARALLATVKQIVIPTDVSLGVFHRNTLPVYYQRTLKAFPGMQELPLGTQVALISLVYNRGASMVDKNKKLEDRQEMRAIRDAVRTQDLTRIAAELRHMERIWVGTKIAKGMKKRRESEAELVDRSIQLLNDCQPQTLGLAQFQLA